MSTQTFQKRQKEMARREKQKLKLARKLERKSEKARRGDATDEEVAGIAQGEEPNAGTDVQEAP